MKLKDLMSIVYVGLIVWCIVFSFFLIRNLGNVFNMFQEIDVSEDIRNIISKAALLENRLLLIDKNILKLIHNVSADSPIYETLFCKMKKNKPITFALLYPSNSSLQVVEHILLPILKAWEIGFWVETIINSRPKKFSLYHTNLPLGFILRKGDRALIIEIVLLHEREGDFWWHGSFYQDLHYEVKLENLKAIGSKDDFVLNEEGAFDKFRVQTVKINNIALNVPDNISLFLNENTKFIECNYELADKYYRTYGKDITIRAIQFSHKVRKILLRTKFILDELQVPFWISSGTLLGYYRQCGVIPYSRDIDIGVFRRDYRPGIVEKFMKSKIQLKYEFGKLNDSYELSFLFAGTKLDIFFFYEEGDTYWNGGHNVKYLYKSDYIVGKYKYVFPKFTLCWTEFLDLKVRIPCETESYIKANYGPDWFTPQPKWNFVASPFNVHLVAMQKKTVIDHMSFSIT